MLHIDLEEADKVSAHDMDSENIFLIPVTESRVEGQPLISSLINNVKRQQSNLSDRPVDCVIHVCATFANASKFTLGDTTFLIVPP
jgi:hypothetical protein